MSILGDFYPASGKRMRCVMLKLTAGGVLVLIKIISWDSEGLVWRRGSVSASVAVFAGALGDRVDRSTSPIGDLKVASVQEFCFFWLSVQRVDRFNFLYLLYIYNSKVGRPPTWASGLRTPTGV